MLLELRRRIRSHGSGVGRFKVFGKLEISPLSRRKSSGWVWWRNPFFIYYVRCSLVLRTYTHSLSFCFFSFSFFLFFVSEGEGHRKGQANNGMVWLWLTGWKRRGSEGGRERERERKCPESGWLVGWLVSFPTNYFSSPTGWIRFVFGRREDDPVRRTMDWKLQVGFVQIYAVLFFFTLSTCSGYYVVLISTIPAYIYSIILHNNRFLDGVLR